ncbi:MAG: hypothetical protein M9930_07460 [Anaerolineae bacterium]|nr:hypothetical protein [Anaerolineae bacterium]
MQVFYIDKTQNTMADSLKAAGFMRILAELFEQQVEYERPDLLLTDCGYYYEIEATKLLDLTRVPQTVLFMPTKFLKTVKNAASLPTDNPLYLDDYEAERDRRKEFFDTHFSNLEKTAKRAYAIGEDHPALEAIVSSNPHRDWDLFRALNPASIIGYNNLLTQWYEVAQAGLLGELCLLLVRLFSQPGNDLDSAESAWKTLAKPYKWSPTATASQLLNPSQGKGINKALPNGVGLSNLKNFWLLEYLKAVGLFEIAITRTMRGVSDRKTYVPAFGRMSRERSKAIDERFRRKMPFSETAVRSDILTVLNYLQTFIDYVQTPSSAEPDPFGSEEPIQPARFMNGFHTVFYKDLGNAIATMNISFLNLPGWVRIMDEADVITFQELLAEHKQVIEQLDESISDQLSLLQAYRDFIVADHLDPFFEFTTLFSSYLIRQGEKGAYAPKRLSTENLRRLIMSNDSQQNLTPILESKGFRNIATAIRRSTISAQYRKKAFDDRRYDVRYGLGRDLMRQAQYSSDFLIALSEFMQSYNQENAQVLDSRPGPYRPSITTEDIEDIVRLIDAYGSAELIAKMLIAFGYAREPRQEDTQLGDQQ